MPDTTGSFLRLPEHECLELVATTTVGRLAFVDSDGQQLVPVNFVLDNGDIVFRTMPGTVLASLAGGHDDVAFGVDHHDDTYQQGWSVTLVGSTAAVGADDVAAFADRRPRPWAPGERDLLVRLTPRHVDGRKVRRR